MNAVAFSKIESQFIDAADESAYEAWFAREVQASLDEDGPGIPHDEVMAKMDAIIERARLGMLSAQTAT